MSDFLQSLAAVAVGGGIGVAGTLLAGQKAIRRDEARQRTELDHDRQVRQREDLIGVIDDALKASQSGAYALSSLKDEVAFCARENIPLMGEDWDKSRRELPDAVRGLNWARARLAARLKDDHPLTEAVEQCRVKLGVARMITPAEGTTPLDKDTAELEKSLVEVTTAIENAQTEAERVIRLE
jgi:hypothetical protein